MSFATTPVAAEVGQNQPNPLAAISQIAGLQNSLNQNRMFQAKAVAGQYLEQSMGPNGQPDPAKLNAFLSADPRTAPYAPEILQNAFGIQQSGLQNTGLGIANQTASQALAAKQYQTLQGALASTTDDSEVPGVIGRLVKTGQLSPDFAANVAGGNVPGLDASSLKVLRQQSVMAQANPTEVAANIGTPSTVNTGAGTKAVVTKVGPQGATVEPAQGDAAFIPNSLGPKDLATPISTVDANGTATMSTLGQYIGPDGAWKGGVPHPMTALGPLSQAANAALGSAYGPQIATFEQTAASAPNQRNLIENIRQEAGQFDEGPQSDAYKRFGELLTEYGIKAPDFANLDQTAAREAFAKSTTMLLGSQQQALHMDQDAASRQTAQLSVPGSMTTKDGINKVLGLIEGNTDMLDAAGKAWAAQKEKGGAASWGQFQMEFPERVPPSIFQAQYMSPDQIADMQKGWSKAKVADWQARYNKAKQLGWLPNGQ